MAESKKMTVQRSVEAYHQALTDSDLDERIGDLAARFGAWEAARAKRIQELERLATEERAAEDAVVAAWESALAAGGKSRALESIGLKPAAALAAVKRRNSAPAPRKTAANSNTAPPPPAAPSLTTSPRLVASAG